MDAINEEEVN